MDSEEDQERYRAICFEIKTRDEINLQTVLDKMLEKIYMTDEDFTKSLIHHM